MTFWICTLLVGCCVFYLFYFYRWCFRGRVRVGLARSHQFFFFYMDTLALGGQAAPVRASLSILRVVQAAISHSAKHVWSRDVLLFFVAVAHAIHLTDDALLYTRESLDRHRGAHKYSLFVFSSSLLLFFSSSRPFLQLTEATPRILDSTKRHSTYSLSSSFSTLLHHFFHSSCSSSLSKSRFTRFQSPHILRFTPT